MGKSESLILPLTIAVVGVVGIWMITHRQIESGRELADVQWKTTEKIASSTRDHSTQIARLDREVKLLGIIGDNVRNGSPQSVELAAALLQELEGPAKEAVCRTVLSAARSPEAKRIAGEEVERARLWRIAEINRPSGDLYRVEPSQHCPGSPYSSILKDSSVELGLASTNLAGKSADLRIRFKGTELATQTLHEGENTLSVLGRSFLLTISNIAECSVAYSIKNP